MTDPQTAPQNTADKVQFSFRDGDAVRAPIATMEAFVGETNAPAVRIEPGEDARLLLPFLGQIALVEVNFPAYGDGRGYSAARILREAGYEGELRAIGDVLIDQLSHMRRCGFDSFAPEQTLNKDDAKAAFERWPEVYQPTTDGRQPIWNLRHGRG